MRHFYFGGIFLFFSFFGWAQNDPCTAIFIDNNMLDFQSFSTVGMTNSGIPDPGCGGAANNDLWLAFTAPASGILDIATLPGSMGDAAAAVYLPPCIDLTLVACADDDNCGNTNMPVFQFTDLFPGATYLLRIWPEGSSPGTFEIRLSEGPPAEPLDLLPVGNAFQTTSSCYQLTASTGSQTGCAWSPDLADFSQAIDNTIILNFGTFDSNGADGICMVYHNDPDGFNTCGSNGGDIAAAGIQNSFIIEFDTWDNSMPTHGDIADDHVSIDVNGDFANPISGPVSLGSGNVEDGDDHEIRFTWDPASNFYEVYFDGALMLSGNYDIINNCFGGQTSAICGFTASTGGSVNTQTVCNPAGDVYPAGTEVITDVEICEGETYFAGGANQSTTGSYSDIYAAHNGCDSIITTNLTVNPASNTYLSESICPGDCITIASNTFCGQGTYQVILPNYLGCDSIITIDIAEVEVEAAIVASSHIDCNTPTVTLDGIFSTPSNAIYIWTAEAGGNIISPTNESTVIVDAAGVYNLEVVSIVNDLVCSNTTFHIVDDHADDPFIFIEPPSAIGCDNGLVSINASASSGTGPLIYDWSGPGIGSGNGTSVIEVFSPGEYILTLTDFDNGCSSVDTVLVVGDSNEPVAVANVNGAINCTHPTLLLDGSGSSEGAAISYEWTTSDGNIISESTALTPEVDSSGTYTLTVTNNNNACTSSATVTVEQDTTVPDPTIELPEQINCFNPESTLQQLNPLSDINLIYTWTTTDGNIISGIDSSMCQIDAGGNYLLTVSDTTNGCIASDSVMVSADLTDPVADAGVGVFLGCNIFSAQLDGSNSSQGDPFEYLWTSNDGYIVSGMDSMAPVINGPGTYNLLVINTQNGCSAIDSVLVEQDNTTPHVEGLVNGKLTCTQTTLTIDASASTQASNYTYEWTTIGGNIVDTTDLFTPVVDMPGTYTLTIMDVNNDCSASANFIIQQDIIPPEVEAGPGFTITCDSTQFILDPTGSSFGPFFNFEWTTDDGQFVNLPPQAMTPAIDAAGSYVLSIKNIQNGCNASDTVVISIDTLAPQAAIALPDTLTCSVDSIILNASNSSTGNSFFYLWSNAEGHPISNSTTLSPGISAPGFYDLVLINSNNGCMSDSSILVVQDTIAPEANAGPLMELNCYTPELTLNATGSTGDHFSYSWSSIDGNFTSAQDTLTPSVNAPGNYELMVTNTSNDCSTSTSLNISENFNAPIAHAGTPFELLCGQISANLDGNGSDSGSNIAYLWTTTNGNILSGETSTTPVIDAAGSYTLMVTDTDSGCSNSDEIEISLDANIPTADAGLPDTLTCSTTSLQLNASNSSSGANFVYAWSTTDGNLVSGQNDLNPTIDMPGTYSITVTDTGNNCENTSSVTITENTTPPIADAGSADYLSCSTLLLSLDASNSSLGSNFSYQWSSTDGNILNGANTLSPQIDAPGMYEIVVLNSSNGCEANDFITVTQDTTPPDAMASTSEDLTCTNTAVQVTGNGSSSSNEFSFEWSSTDGNIISDADQIAAQVDEPGIYELLVTNNTNGCMATAQVEVFENITPPVADAGIADLLNCSNNMTTLDASNSSQGMDFTYVWSSTDGNIQSGATSLAPSVNEPGTYQILVTNSINGCMAESEVLVQQDIMSPEINIVEPNTLTCVVFEVQLDAGGSSSGATFDYQWSTNNGNIVSGASTLTPVVNSTGNYTLSVTNNDNGCISDAAIGVSENTLAPIANAGASFVLNCVNDLQYLDGNGSQSGPDISYQWTAINGEILSGVDTPSPAISNAGVFQILVTNETNGCTATDEVTITEDVPVAESLLSQPVCYGDSGHITFVNVIGGTPPYVYAIDGGNDFFSTGSFNNVPPGNYEMVIQDANGCEYQEAVSIHQGNDLNVEVEPLAEILLGDSYQIAAQINVSESSLSEISWTPSLDLSCVDCLDPVATPFETTIYTITIKSEEGCEDSESIRLLVDKRPRIYIPNAFSPNGDGFNDEFMIFARTENISKINSFLIFSRWGELVFEVYDSQPNNPVYGWDGKYEGKELNAAVFTYFTEIEFINGTTEIFKGDVSLVK